MRKRNHMNIGYKSKLHEANINSDIAVNKIKNAAKAVKRGLASKIFGPRGR